jgi:hypothetical protein
VSPLTENPAAPAREAAPALAGAQHRPHPPEAPPRRQHQEHQVLRHAPLPHLVPDPQRQQDARGGAHVPEAHPGLRHLPRLRTARLHLRHRPAQCRGPQGLV